MKKHTIKILTFSFLIIISSCVDSPSGGAIEYVRTMLFQNPESEIVIGWNSNTGSDHEDRYIVYDTIDHGADIHSYSFKESLSSQNTYKSMDNNFVHLKNLEEDTLYYFVIIDGDKNSVRYQFKTAASDPTQLLLIAGGDSRNNRDVRQLANRMVAKLQVDAIMFGGDYTDFGTNKQWRNWFKDWELTINSNGRITPLIVTRGNHERSTKILSRLFNAPEKNYYATSFGKDFLKIITLDSNASSAGDQKDWLKNELAQSSEYKHLFTQYHHPMRPHVEDKKEGKHYKYWAQLFYDYGVDISMESDSHSVKETFPLRPSYETGSEEGFIRDDQNGTIYLGEGCWGAPLRESNDAKSWTKASGSFNQFKWIKVNDKIEYKTIIIDKYINNLSDLNRNRFELSEEIKTWF